MSSHVNPTLMRRRWWVMALLGFVVMVVEVIDHYNPQKSLLSDVEFLLEILFLGVMLPLVGGFLLGILERVGGERDEVLDEREHQSRLSQALSRSSQWDVLVENIVNFPSSVLPVVSSDLRVYEPREARFKLAAEWKSDAHPSTQMYPPPLPEVCKSCALPRGPSPRLFAPCVSMHGQSHMAGFTRYCLPLVHAEDIVALLHVDLPRDLTITSHQAHTMNAVAPEMALAIKSAQLERSVSAQTEITASERQRIARDLHDTLGQNICLLRLKLDQLSSQDALLGITAIRMELERMRDLANDAYYQVRGTLTELRSDVKTDFGAALDELGNSLKQRSNLSVRVECQGQPARLSSDIQRQLLFICREALNNIEKHAQASQVDIRMIWTEQGLQIRIEDDGLGFLADDAQSNNHYGLKIMHDRADEIHGCLTLDTMVNAGTRVNLWVPLSEEGELTPSTAVSY